MSGNKNEFNQTHYQNRFYILHSEKK